jgi:hypothetical protein
MARKYEADRYPYPLMRREGMSSFLCWDPRVRDDGWLIAREFGTHRDADSVTRSNWRVICRELERLDPEYEAHGDMRASHWACGWYEHLLVDWRRVDLVRVLDESLASLECYPLLSDDDHSELEWEEHSAGQCGEGCSLCECEKQEQDQEDLDA